MAATAKDVSVQLQKLGYETKVIDTREEPLLEGVNVWDAPTERYPLTTVWEPRADIPEDGWAWGDQNQFGAYSDDDAETVAAKVSASIPALRERLKGGRA